MYDFSPLNTSFIYNMQGSDSEILRQKYPQEAHVDNMSLASNQPLSYDYTSGGSTPVNHKNCISGRPIRRRSRASKKTPITLLNANLSNFRALVQQFTGCHSAPPTCYKGPVTLNFSSCHSGGHRNSHKERSEQIAVTKYAPGGGESLTLEDFGMENFSLRDLRGAGDYSTSTWEATAARNDSYC